MNYHRTQDGAIRQCKARPGHCPLQDAEHGESRLELQQKFETLMEENTFAPLTKTPEAKPAPPRLDLLQPAPPRVPAAEIGTQGAMLHYKEPALIKEQLEALAALGIEDETQAVLEKYMPMLASAQKHAALEAVNFDKLYQEPQEYTYGRTDTEYGEEWFTSEHYTWVGKAHYGLQTAALNSLMDKLETGTLQPGEVELYGKALGNTSKTDSGHLAFNYNPHRQDKDFFNNVKNRFAQEGFGEEKIDERSSLIRMPKFFWQGLDDEAKQRVASVLLSAKYERHYQHTDLKEKAFATNSRASFGRMLSATFTPNSVLDGQVRKEHQPVRFDLGDLYHDASYPVIKGSYSLTDAGVVWREDQRLFYSKKDREQKLQEKDRLSTLGL